MSTVQADLADRHSGAARRSRPVEVEMLTLTQVLDTHAAGREVAFLKIDVEGHEFDTIKGCAEILKTIQPIFIIEIELRHAHYPIHEIFDFITNFGYEVFYFDRKTLKTVPFDFNQMAAFQKDEYLNDFNRENYKVGLDFSFPLFLRKERAQFKLAKLQVQDAEFGFSFEK